MRLEPAAAGPSARKVPAPLVIDSSGAGAGYAFETEPMPPGISRAPINALVVREREATQPLSC